MLIYYLITVSYFWEEITTIERLPNSKGEGLAVSGFELTIATPKPRDVIQLGTACYVTGLCPFTVAYLSASYYEYSNLFTAFYIPFQTIPKERVLRGNTEFNLPKDNVIIATCGYYHPVVPLNQVLWEP